ncbi:MAG: hypothetical protein HGA96_01195 [Desulfobulbaceae bacterium]|nr:hypothetical protein [Desulfobulbaceae bacterium]
MVIISQGDDPTNKFYGVLKMKKDFLVVALAAVIIGAGSQAALASGPHDANCVSCHNIHYATGNYIIGPQPNTSIDNPASKVKTAGIDSLCLGCHNDAEGIMPIHLTTTHPTGVAPTYVKVPEKLLRDGKMSCVSCHNPHPSNGNYKYLVADTKKGNSMGVFCAVCHTEQADNAERTSAGTVPLNFGPRTEARVMITSVAKSEPAAKAAKSETAAKPAVAATNTKAATTTTTTTTKPAAVVKY